MGKNRPSDGAALTGRRGPVWLCWGIVLFLLAACSGGVQHNDLPLLASKGGGTSGGPIQGQLTVRVFDEATRFPAPGIIVALGGSGDRLETTNRLGVAVFGGVFGPQDIHIFACRGCSGEEAATQGFPYQMASYYQINAAHVAIPIIGREPRSSARAVEGKVFGTEKEETTHILAIDETGRYLRLSPTGSITYQVIEGDLISSGSSSPSVALNFLFSKDLDDWAATDPAAGRQEFNRTAVVGRVIDGSKNPKAGVKVSARYFNGTDAGRPYYFNDAGKVDPSLTATSKDGRFALLRLFPQFDLFISAESLGVGVGTTKVSLLSNGTIVLPFQVFPLLQSRVDLAGRVVVHRLDFREEERINGPLSGGNFAVPGAAILFSGDNSQTDVVIAGSGPLITGNYQSVNHLLQNGKYVVSVFGGSTFRTTFQELNTGIRSQIVNYPLAAIPQATLSNMLQAGSRNVTLDITASHAEILGRVVEETDLKDLNGDPIVTPLFDAKVQVLDDNGIPINSLFYLNQGGQVDPVLEATSPSGGFVFFDLRSNLNPPSVFTVVATDASTGALLSRRFLTLPEGTAHLIDLVKKKTPLPNIEVGSVVGVDGKPADVDSTTLIGGRPGSSCPEPPAICSLPAVGDYLVRMGRATGGGDYGFFFPASTHQRLTLSAFRVSPSGTLNGGARLPSLDPTTAGTTVQRDIDLQPVSALRETTGSVSLPPNFKIGDLQSILVGSVEEKERALIGVDPNILLKRPAAPFRALSFSQETAGSYFISGALVSSAGDRSETWVRGLSAIPAVQDLTFMPTPRLITPVRGQPAVGFTPTFSWSPPDDGPVDYYEVFIGTRDDRRLWEAWVPGDIHSITLPPFPAGGPDLLRPFTAGSEVNWSVVAVRAGGLSLNEFDFSELPDRIIGNSSSLSFYIP
jgi:hypothetical protein